MAAGDAFTVTPTSTANSATLAIQPGAGVEAVIHNVYGPTGSAYTLAWTDGSNPVTFLSMPAGGGALNLQCHVTNTRYLLLTNTSGATAYFAADGMTTK